MNTFRIPIAILLLIAFSSVLFLPAMAMAASPLDLLGQSASNDNSSFSIWNVFLGLLLGKVLGNNATAPQTSTASNISNIKDIFNAFSKGSSAATNNNSSKGDDIIATAQKYMGVPYVWGGETPSGFDCSGFTQYVMKQNGIDLPRTAADQFATGTPVDKNNLQIGDLIFFTTYKPGASHVGFYMGNNKFIHASSASAKVTTNSLDESFYTEHYIGARRYIN